MPRFPGAVWRDVGAPNRYSNGLMHAQLGVVLHVNDAQSDDLFGWITGDHDMSCHFQVNKAGKVYQYIDTNFSSWCQKDGNNTYLSIESQGLAGESATKAQIDAIGKILAWVHKIHGMPLQLAEAPGQRGFGWHGMGAAHGADWGHPDCPGVRRNQRTAMLAVAHGTIPTGEDDMSDAQFEALTKQISALHDQLDAKADSQSNETDRLVRILINGDATRPSVYTELDAALDRLAAIEAKLTPPAEPV